MSLAELNRALANAKTGEWLYAQVTDLGLSTRVEWKVTNGYQDKFWVCVWDLFSCCGTSYAVKTQKIINDVFTGWGERYKADEISNKPFSFLPHLEEGLECREALVKVTLAWGRAIEKPSQINHLSGLFQLSSFHETLEKVEAIWAVLPNRIFLEFSNAKTSLTRAIGALREKVGAPVEERAALWYQVAKALYQLKIGFLHWEDKSQGELKQYLEVVDWEYRIGETKIAPKPLDLTTAGEHKKRIDYLEVRLGLEGDARSAIGDPAQEDTIVDGLIQKLRGFFDAQTPSQRRPVSITFFGEFEQAIMHQFAQKEWPFYEKLMNRVLLFMEENPRYFVHQATLYGEAKGDKNRGACLSRVTGPIAQRIKQSNKKTFAPSRPLRPAVKQVIERLQSERDMPYRLRACNTQEKIGPTEELAILRELHSLELGRNSVFRLLGKEMGCHIEILEEAFPYFKNLRGFQGSDDPSLLNLDGVRFPFTIAPQYGEWVLDALVAYAYLREQPNLPIECSKETQQAYQLYLQCLDYLSAGGDRPEEAPAHDYAGL